MPIQITVIPGRYGGTGRIKRVTNFIEAIGIRVAREFVGIGSDQQAESVTAAIESLHPAWTLLLQSFT